jgi:DNA-binding LacI/PurR family transcriptional regulator
VSPSLRDVAEHAGVSLKTVSNVVHGYVHVRPSTRARVLASIDELGYRPNVGARALRGGRTGLVALALPDLTVPYFAELVGHVRRRAARAGLSLVVEETDGTRELELEALEGLRNHTIDGLILSPLALTGDDLANRRDRTPLVLLGERSHDIACDHVEIDNVLAARMATGHLLERGCRRVVALGARHSAMADLRLQGYRESHAEAGVPVDEDLVVATDWFLRPDGLRATASLVGDGVRFDGIFAFNDLLAVGAVRALHEAGLRVPDDVAVAGFDDLEEVRYTVPTITSVAPDRGWLAEQAVRLLVERLAGDVTAPPRVVSAQVALHVRESSAAPGAQRSGESSGP